MKASWTTILVLVLIPSLAGRRASAQDEMPLRSLFTAPTFDPSVLGDSVVPKAGSSKTRVKRAATSAGSKPARSEGVILETPKFILELPTLKPRGARPVRAATAPTAKANLASRPRMVAPSPTQPPVPNPPLEIENENRTVNPPSTAIAPADATRFPLLPLPESSPLTPTGPAISGAAVPPLTVEITPGLPGEIVTGEQSSGVAVPPTSSVADAVQGQPSYIPSSMFRPNGLPGRGHLWFSAEALFGEYGDSNSLIGDERAPDAFAERFQAVNLGVLDGQHIGLSELDPSLVGQQLENGTATGYRLRGGVRTATNGGIEFDGTWMSEYERSWQRGLGGLAAGADPTTVRVTAALPLFDGNAGYAVPFDQFFRVGITTETNLYGVHFSPSGHWWGAILIQPAISFRYMKLNEGFGFAAADSGLEYEHNADGTPVASTLDPPVAVVPPYQTTLAATGDTDLMGALVGLQYSTSGRKIRLSGSTRIGLMYADSTQTLAGQGFGNGFAPGFDPTIAFSDSRSSVYTTGMLEQTVNLDVEIFRILPQFRRVDTQSSLVLRLGWSIVALNEVVRPVDTINWNGFPLTPSLNSTRNDFYLQTWSAGFIFQY